MAPSDGWPRIVVERFDGETVEGYRERSTRIVEIVTDFRLGRYDSESGEQLERELVTLQDPGLAYSAAPRRAARPARRRTRGEPTLVH